MDAEIEDAPERMALSRPTAGGHLVAKSAGALPPRLKGESEEAYARFASWLQPDEGVRRSMSRTAREVGVNVSTLREQATRYEWNQRAIDFDRRTLAASAASIVELQAHAAVSHASLAQDLVDQCQAVIRRAGELLEDDELPLDVLEAWQRIASGASKILEKAQKAARLAMGQSDSNQSIKVEVKTEPSGQLDLDRVSRDELRLLSAARAYQNAVQDRYQGGGDTGPDCVERAQRRLAALLSQLAAEAA